MIEIDLAAVPIRALNAQFHALEPSTDERHWRVLNPDGRHAIAVGLTQPIKVEIMGHAGYYCGGMNKEATIVAHGHCGVGVGENIMSGLIRVKGNASQSAGATGRGGMIVIEGNAGSRCGISMKGIDIVVGGSVGHMAAFMAQAGNLVVCGDAGAALGDSIYEADLYVQGRVESRGADCVEKEMTEADMAKVAGLLSRAAIAADARRFRRYGSARALYNFHVDRADAY